MIKRMLVMLAAVLVLAVAFGAYKAHQMHAGMAQMAAGFSPPTVSTARATMQSWQPKLDAVGTVRAVNGADLSAEVAGIVDGLYFKSGGDVNRGDLLVQLRDADEVAQLRALQSNAAIAQINLDRDMKQLKEEAVAQATVDSDKAALVNARAQADAQQALIDKKTIRAPFAGHLGIRQVDLGQYLNPGSALVTLQQLDPLYVDFNLPEQNLPSLAANQNVTLTVDAVPGRNLTGQVVSLNSKVDEATRNVQIRASFANPDHKVLPGMFAHVAVDVGKAQQRLTLPQTAIVFNTYGNTVYIVDHGQDKDGKPSTTVKQAVVATGETRGDQIEIKSGVKEGEEIVASGQVKLRNGMAIMINNDNQPPVDANPTPHDR